MGGTFQGKNRGEHRGGNFRGGTALALFIYTRVCVSIKQTRKNYLFRSINIEMDRFYKHKVFEQRKAESKYMRKRNCESRNAF